MLKINNCLFFGMFFLLCSNVKAIDYKSNMNAFSSDLNVSSLSDDYVIASKLECDFPSKLKCKSNTSQIVRYSTKCRGKNNPYNNHAFLEVIDITKLIENAIKENKYLPY